MGGRLIERNEKRRGERRESGAECLHVNFFAPRIEKRNAGFVRFGASGLGDGLKRGDACKRQRAGEREAARGGEPHAKPGEGAWADGDGQPIEIGKTQRRFGEHGFEKRHQGFGMAAAARLKGRCQHIPAIRDGG